MNPMLLRIEDVSSITSLSRSTIYRMIADGDFPRQIAIGNRQARWSHEEVVDWCQSKIAACS